MLYLIQFQCRKNDILILKRDYGNDKVSKAKDACNRMNKIHTSEGRQYSKIMYQFI